VRKERKWKRETELRRDKTEGTIKKEKKIEVADDYERASDCVCPFPIENGQTISLMKTFPVRLLPYITT